MPRPLFGYSIVDGETIVNETEMRVVKLILDSKKGESATRLRELLKNTKYAYSKDAIDSLIYRVRRHRKQYTSGIARIDLEPRENLKVLCVIR